jgi:putative alpha-1,2-mannosidase
VGEYAGFSGHHHFQASRAPLEFGVVNGYYTSDGGGAVQAGAREANSSAFGPAVAYLKFDRAGGPVTVATACSFISPEKAEDNMIAELAAGSLFDLDAHAAEVKAVWEEKLGKITVAPGVTNAGAVNKDTELKTRAVEEFQNNSMIFYTALWHSLLLPRAVSDADGAYLSFTDGSRTVQYTTPQDSQKSDAGLSFSTYYDDYSMWDIFRAQVPLLNLLLPSSTVRDFVASLVVKAQQGRWMPIFPAWNSYTGEMVGDHCGVWVADAVLKGIISPLDPVVLGLAAQGNALNRSPDAPSTLREDRQGALYYLLKNALAVPLSDYEYRQSRGRRSLDSCLQYGYIPLEDLVLESPHPRQQVSRTLEYAFDDFVALKLLQAVRAQHPESLQGLDWSRLLREVSPHATLLRGVTETSSVEEILDAVTAQLTASSANYRNVLDSAGVGFVRGRHENGTWAESDASFDPAVYYPWLTETNVWQYTWFAPHGMADLIALYGGDDAFLSKLNTFFDEGWYNHGNEPDHHAAYLAAYAHSSGRGRGRNRSASSNSSNEAIAGEIAKNGRQKSKGEGAAAGGAWQVQERVAAIIRSQYLASEQGLPVSSGLK